jgi:hypothetical protein
MKKKILYGMAVFVVAITAAWNVSLAMQENHLSSVVLADIEVLADSESNGGNYTCTSGGPGSSQCSTSANIGGSGTGCSVTCISGYYACCNNYENKCQCRLY